MVSLNRPVGDRPKGPRKAEYREAASLREALRRFQRQSDQIVRRHGLTPQRYELLLMIKTARDGSERAALGELAERLQLAQSTVTELVHRAEGAGLVRREISPNRRGAITLSLTEAGERGVAGACADLRTERRRLTAIWK